MLSGTAKNIEQEQLTETNYTNQPAVRNILGFIDKYDRVEQQELLSQSICHWLLSIEDFRLPIEYPAGLITQMPPLNDDHILILIPYTPDIPGLDYRELHQIIRELTIGMYVLNAHPSLQLEANNDQSTTCQLPPAYIDTKLGQIMINTDYWLKALWHGSFINREKRIKFSERWRQLLDVDSNGIAQTKKSIFQEFVNSGLCDIAKDTDYTKIFDKSDLINNGNGQHSIGFGVGMTASFSKKTAKSSNIEFAQQLVMTQEQIQEEISHFMNYIDDVSLQMTFGLKTIKQYKNLYEFSPDFNVNITCKTDNNKLDEKIFERIKPILNSHEKYIKDNFANKDEIKRNMVILNLVSFLIPLLVGLKKRMKIPDLNNLLPTLAGDEVHTERDLPPLMLGDDFKSNTFSARSFNKLHEADKNNTNPYFNLHGGIQFELETNPIEEYSDEEFESQYEQISKSCKEVLNSYLQSDQQQEYKIPVAEINNKKYWAVRIDFESYYAQFPQKPYWVNKLNEELSKLRPKRLPMTDIQVYDLYKKYYGYKKATKLKNIQSGLKVSAQRGCLGVFQSFSRKTPISNLARHDDYGLSLVHYAAIFNRPNIIANLCMLGVDSNLRQQIKYAAIGAMPVHYAARCGSLDSLSCILANYGNISNYDDKGWAPIHHAAFFDNVPGIRLFCKRQNELLEIQTKNESIGRKTPLLVAASSGALEATKCLIELGANLNFQDEFGNNCIHVAAHRTHTNILEHFIFTDYPQLPTWKFLVNMLSSEKEDDREATVKCLQILTYSNRLYWRSVMEYGGIEKMCAILKKYSSDLLLLNEKTSKLQTSFHLAQNDSESTISAKEQQDMYEEQMKAIKESIITKKQSEIALNTLSVLCNLCEQFEIKKCLSENKELADILMKIIRYSQNEDMESRVTILISDIVIAEEHLKIAFEERGCLDYLMKLLERETEDLLVNTVNALEIMCKNNLKNQDYCCEKGVLASLINLLYFNSDFLKTSVSAAISAITHNNRKNQQIALKQGVLKALVSLLKSRNMSVQLKVAMALESLAINNVETQQAILTFDAATYMIKLVEDHKNSNKMNEYRRLSNQDTILLHLDYASDNVCGSNFVLFDIKALTNDTRDKERMYYVGATIKSNMEDWSIIVREQAAITLWTLAGIQKPQRRSIAEKIGSSQIMSMLMSKSEKLQYVGCKCMIALVLENVTYQNLILRDNGTDPLIRLLRTEKASSRVILAILETIAALCVDIAHVNNPRTQMDLTDKGTIDLVLNILNNPPTKYIQIETAYALACLILNRPNLEAVKGKLNIQLILELINTDDLELRLRAGLAITVLAFNNNDKQYDIKAFGGISYECYRPYFEDQNVDVLHLCRACFQVVVLARVINDKDQVWLTALGIGRLVQLLLLDDDDVVIQTASYMSSLAHTRPGITDAMITCDAVDILCDRIYSSNDQIRFASAVTLGYLTYNRTASRLLLHNCRNVTKLYDTLRSILRPENKISEQFIESYETALKLGLPKMLVRNKVSCYDPNVKKDYIYDLEESPKFFRHVDKEEITELKNSTNFKNQSNRSQSAPSKKLLTSLIDIDNINTDSGIINEVEEENDLKNKKNKKTNKIVRPVTYAQTNRKISKPK